MRLIDADALIEKFEPNTRYVLNHMEIRCLIRNFPTYKETDEPTKGHNYWRNICDLQHKQMQKGMRSYGCMLEDSNLTEDEALTYLEEELIDALMYIERRKDRKKVDNDSPRVKPVLLFESRTKER